MTTPDFDIRALHLALNEQRRVRGLSWQSAAREISSPFERLPGTRPVSASTLTGMAGRHVVEGDGVLQMLRWLGRSPESFIHGFDGEASLLPDAGPGRILRFDTRVIHASLDAQRLARGLTWKHVAAEIGGLNPASLTHLAAGGRTSFPDVARIARWLGRDIASLTHASPY